MPTILQRLGNTEAVPQGTKITFTYANGREQILTWKGNADALNTLRQTLEAIVADNPTYDSVEFDPGRGNGVLVARLVEDGPVIYELFTNEIMKPIEFATSFSALKASEIREVYHAYDLGTANADEWFVGANSTLMTTLYRYLCAGVMEFYESAWVLRISQVVSKRSLVVASKTGVNTVQAPPYTNTVNTLIGDLPAGEWLKRAPQVRTIGPRKWTISQEYWWSDKWPAIPYGGTWVPVT